MLSMGGEGVSDVVEKLAMLIPEPMKTRGCHV
jgi:hypothetical protein